MLNFTGLNGFDWSGAIGIANRDFLENAGCGDLRFEFLLLADVRRQPSVI